MFNNDFEVVGTFSKYFQILVPNLNLKLPSDLLWERNIDEILTRISK